LCAYAAGVGVKAAFEFGAFSHVQTISDVLDVIRRANHPNGSILVDPLHLARTQSGPSDLVGIDPKLFSYAQLCDATAVGPPRSNRRALMEEAGDGRLQIGAGALPLKELLSVLPPRLPLSIESRSRTVREAYPDPVERARATLAATRRLLDS